MASFTTCRDVTFDSEPRIQNQPDSSRSRFSNVSLNTARSLARISKTFILIPLFEVWDAFLFLETKFPQNFRGGDRLC